VNTHAKVLLLVVAMEAAAVGCMGRQQAQAERPVVSTDSLEYTPAVRELLRQDVKRLVHEKEAVRISLERDKVAARIATQTRLDHQAKAATAVREENEARAKLAEEVQVLQAQRDSMQSRVDNLRHDVAAARENVQDLIASMQRKDTQGQRPDLDGRPASESETAATVVHRPQESVRVTEDLPRREDLVGRWSNGRGFCFRLDSDRTFKVTNALGRLVTSGTYRYAAGELTFHYREGWEEVDQLRWLEGKRVLECRIQFTDAPGCHAGDCLRGTRVN
jgi:cell division protein FtsB